MELAGCMAVQPDSASWSLATEVADPAVAAIVNPSPASAGALHFQLRGLQAGVTRVRLWVVHARLHVLYETPPIDVIVR